MRDAQSRFLDYMSGARRGPWASVVRGALSALAAPYRMGCALRTALYDWGLLISRELEAIVISVGNLTAGGTGKTPMVIWLGRWLRQRSIPTAILSRGYGPKGLGGSDSDEALLFRRHLPKVPHLVGADRYASGRKAIADHGAECILLDDGFQHLRLARDLDIVLIDALEPWGHGHVLPRGLLREPPGALRRADVIVLTRCDLCEKEDLRAIQRRIREVCGYRPVVESAHQPVRFYRHGTEESRSLEWVRDRPVYAFSALGNPRAFPATLGALGAEVVEHRSFRDHHWYDEADLDALAAAARHAEAQAIVTTEKDAVKIRAFPTDSPPLFVLAVELTLGEGEDQLVEVLEQVLAG
ncbi:MAG: tetraacyldisaccharide 4'-kinase [Planctomycetota bacterium]